MIKEKVYRIVKCEDVDGDEYYIAQYKGWFGWKDIEQIESDYDHHYFVTQHFETDDEAEAGIEKYHAVHCPYVKQTVVKEVYLACQ